MVVDFFLHTVLRLVPFRHRSLIYVGHFQLQITNDFSWKTFEI